MRAGRGQVAESYSPPFPFQVVQPPGNLWSDYQQTHTPIFCTFKYRFQKREGYNPQNQNDSFPNSPYILPILSATQGKATPSCFFLPSTQHSLSLWRERQTAKPQCWNTGTQSCSASRIICTQVQKLARSRPEVNVCAPFRFFIIQNKNLQIPWLEWLNSNEKHLSF